MSKKSIAILWGVNIALYIANIILTCIFGATLIPCIIGWLLASILAGLIIFLEFRLIDKQNTIEVIYKELFKQLIKGSEKRMNEEVLKSELLNKDKEQLVELYLQKCYDTNVEIEQQLKDNTKQIYDKIIKFINANAWEDIKYDAYQCTMGEFTGSTSAIPKYAKKYFDLWKEMFNEDLYQIDKGGSE